MGEVLNLGGLPRDPNPLENGRRTWGHSMVVDPWGEVVGVLAEGEGLVLAELDAARIAEVRARLPALAHRTAVELNR